MPHFILWIGSFRYSPLKVYQYNVLISTVHWCLVNRDLQNSICKSIVNIYFFLLSVYDLFKDDKTFYNLFDEVSEFNVGWKWFKKWSGNDWTVNLKFETIYVEKKLNYPRICLSFAICSFFPFKSRWSQPFKRYFPQRREKSWW